MEQDTVIETVDLTKIYGTDEDSRVIALNKVSIKIQAGEFVSIMGPSGSGKSTLLNILACMDRPTEGQYILAGEDVSAYTRKELAMIRSRELGFVFQSFNLLSRASALENVMLPIVYRRDNPVSASEREELARAALEKVGLGKRLHHLPTQLSGGQQQRVAIARAMINEPALILADEPTGNLDTHSSEEIMELMQRINDQGRTIVVVTHEPVVAHHTRRIIHIQDGEVFSDKVNGEPVTPSASASSKSRNSRRKP
jgi:putative ABC transport system ATP-binding protein